jgi:uncharacterized membrane protein/sporulation protein YlmC with PRC-barrel domain
MVDIPIEARVECADGPCGKSVAVVVNPATRVVTHFVVQDESFSDAEQRMVPMDQVLETTSVSIRLRCTKEQVANMEHFVKLRFIEEQWDEPAYWAAAGDMYYAEPYATPAMPIYEETERIPQGELAVHRGAWVEATDGHVGTVGELVMEPESGQITHLVLQGGHLWGKREITVPLSAIERVEMETIFLNLDKQAIEQLPSIALTRQYRKVKAEGKSVELVTKVFEQPGAAKQALEVVDDLQRRKLLKILDAAMLVKEEDGSTSFKDVRDLQPGKGRLMGAIAGGLVGLIGGPVGVVVGALAGLGAGSLAARWIDLGFSDEFLTGLQEHLQPGSSSVVVLVESDSVSSLVEALERQDGVVFHQTLTDDLVGKLMEDEEPEA